MTTWRMILKPMVLQFRGACVFLNLRGVMHDFGALMWKE